jgi:hypothetical protein
MQKEPGPFVRRWEALAAPVRFLVTFVISAPILWLIHITFLNQPEDRGIFYGLFWGVVVGLVLLLATRSEKMRRAGLTGDEQDREPPV